LSVESRSDYNNNPGNLRPPKDVVYKGQIGVDDKGFAIFENSEFGDRALRNDIEIKLRKEGIKTPSDFIDMYAPKGDENSEESRDNYKILMAQKLGLNSTTDPFPENPVDNIFNAIKAFEGGTWNKPDSKETVKPPDQKPPEESKPAATVEEESFDPQETMLLGGAGYGTGATAGVAKIPVVKAYKKAFDFLFSNKSLPTFQDNAPNSQQSRSGMQNWLDVMLSKNGQKSTLSIEQLEELTKQKINNFSELGAAYKKIMGTPPERVSKTASVDPKTGMPRKIYSWTAGNPGIDTSQYVAKPQTVPQNISQGVVQGLKSIPTIGGFGNIGMGIGMSIPQAIKQYQQGNTSGTLGTLGTGAGAGALMSMVPKLAPGIGAGLSGFDIANRLKKDDTTGAALSAAGTLAPIAALSMLAPPIGVPLGLASAFIPAAINAYRDYRNEKLVQENQ